MSHCMRAQLGLDVRYNSVWLLEIWRILLQLRLMLHRLRLPRTALPDKGRLPGCSAH